MLFLVLPANLVQALTLLVPESLLQTLWTVPMEPEAHTCVQGHALARGSWYLSGSFFLNDLDCPGATWAHESLLTRPSQGIHHHSEWEAEAGGASEPAGVLGVLEQVRLHPGLPSHTLTWAGLRAVTPRWDLAGCGY